MVEFVVGDDGVFERGIYEPVEELAMCAFPIPFVQTEFGCQSSQFSSFGSRELEVSDCSI
ncbi:hypothetical protein A5645_22390 [Mycobacterium asiaticum]|nr:hypothetical protein A5645_22390 [Mycobacterium asiaticum]